ncbi:hypothetical protein Trydic_g12395 [Trypoxylus dichotomus]
MLKLGVLVLFLAAYTIALAMQSLIDQEIDRVGSFRILGGKTITPAACSIFWPGAITARQICTNFQRGKGFCDADSGGPLIHTDTQIQVGIMSFNFHGGCGDLRPDVFTRVSSFMPWIQSILSQ